MKLPQARTENIIEQNLKNETLIYDLNTHKAFNLNETLTIVYKACDGKQTFEELKRKHKFTDDFIYLALDELKSENLLADVAYNSPFANIDRRQVIKKVGLASLMMLPLIAGLVAPAAASAASGIADSSGGSDGSVKAGDPGTYNHACLVTVSGGQYIDVCYAGRECGGTSRGKLCCERSPGISQYYFPGDSVQTPYDTGTAYYFPIDSAPTTSADCGGSIIRCCDGATPTGTCTYTRYQGEDGGDYDDPGPVLGLYFRSCDCACP